MTKTDFSSLLPGAHSESTGAVTEVSSTGVLMEFASNKKQDKKSAADKRKEASFGDYVVVMSGGLAYVGQIKLVQMIEKQQRSPDGEVSVQYSKIGRIKLLSSIDIKKKEILQGMHSYPDVGDEVFIASQDLVQLVGEGGHSRNGSGKGEAVLAFARMLGARNSDYLYITPSILFGRHCAILGSTGSGKSWSIAKLVEECSKLNSKMIVFDASGEYHKLSNATTHAHIGYHPRPGKNSKEVALPFFHLTENDLMAMFKPSGESQAPKLRAAMKSLKLASLVPAMAPGGTILKAHRSKTEYEEEYQHHLARIEDPYANFDIHKLARQIENECVDPQRSPVEPNVWGAPSRIDMANCAPLVTKINDIIHSPSLAPIFNPAVETSLLAEIARFIKERNERVLCISLAGLSFSNNAREIAVNAIGRYLLELGRHGIFKSSPMVIVLDEAHQFLNAFTSEKDGNYTLDSFALVAKEGRKYALNLCLATQRPRDIPDDIMSQMGTMVVHRLSNDHDRKTIERASSDFDVAGTSNLPTLVPGQALLLGAEFPVPLLIQIEAPHAKPESDGPDYAKLWKP